MRRLIIGIGFVVAALALGAFAFAASGPNDSLLPKEQHFLDSTSGSNNGVKSGSAWNMTAVGHDDVANRGFNGDVFVDHGIALVGRWGFFDSSHPSDCPWESGVAVYDVSNPAAPAQVADLVEPGASVEDVVAYRAAYGPLAGHEIAAAGTQYCASPRTDPAAAGHRGMTFWDITNPRSPVLLGKYDVGCCTRGVHEFEIDDRADLGMTIAYVSVPYAERPDASSPNGVRDRAGKGEARLVNVTDPRNPVELSNFGIKRDLGLDPSTGLGCFAIGFGHGMTPSADGKLTFVSYWDAGYITLDTTNPSQPKVLGRWTYAANEDGDAHSASYDNSRKLLFTADEDFCKGGPGVVPGWGYMRVMDASKPGALKQIGEYHTPNSYGKSDPGAGDYVIHNPLVVGTDVYASWYTDGIRVIDAKNPRNPVEVANFVPPAAQNPVHPDQRNTLTNTTQVWGVAYEESTGLVYASDMNSGLWIIKRTK